MTKYLIKASVEKQTEKQHDSLNRCDLIDHDEFLLPPLARTVQECVCQLLHHAKVSKGAANKRLTALKHFWVAMRSFMKVFLETDEETVNVTNVKRD